MPRDAFHFRSRGAISQGGWISQRGAFSEPFRSPFRSCEMRVRSCKMALMCQGMVSQPFRSYEMREGICEMALVCQRVISQLRKFSQRGIGGYETISQWEAIFEARLGGPFSQTGALFRLRNFADHAFSLLLSSS